MTEQSRDTIVDLLSRLPPSCRFPGSALMAALDMLLERAHAPSTTRARAYDHASAIIEELLLTTSP